MIWSRQVERWDFPPRLATNRTGNERDGEAVFIYYFAYVLLPFDTVSEAVSRTPEHWFTGCLARACQEAAALDRAGPDGAPGWVTANVTIGTPSRGDGALLIPVRAEVGGRDAPFASLEADMEVGELGSDVTQITLRGSYRPAHPPDPQSPSGLDHRIAEAAVRGFVEGITTRVSLTSTQASVTRNRSGEVDHLTRPLRSAGGDPP
jgi:hypothetical protein